MHNLFCDNCHSHVCRALQNMECVDSRGPGCCIADCYSSSSVSFLLDPPARGLTVQIRRATAPLPTRCAPAP